MDKTLLLGLEIGSTHLKAGVLDTAGRLLVLAAEAHPQLPDEAGGNCYDPQHL